MSTVKQKVTAINKAVMKEEEAKLQNGNQSIINENANIDIDKIAKKADKDADKVLAKATKEVKSKSKKPKAVSKVKAKVVKKKK
tara:strand:+ start:87 stop:338 length:252 start_codon:yes stop_codon:yes gene_type:complete